MIAIFRSSWEKILFSLSVLPVVVVINVVVVVAVVVVVIVVGRNGHQLFSACHNILLADWSRKSRYKDVWIHIYITGQEDG